MLLGLGADLRRVVLVAHVHHPGAHGAGVHERAAHELGAGSLLYEVALAGEQALVHVGLAGHHHGVGRHLVAAAEHHHVVAHDVVQRHLRARAVADDHGVRARHDAQAVGGDLRAYLLHDADNHVAHDDDHEQHVLVRAGEQHEHRQDHVDGVEQRADVLPHDLAHGARLHVHVGVHVAARHALGHLRGGQSPGFVGHVLLLLSCSSSRRPVREAARLLAPILRHLHAKRPPLRWEGRPFTRNPQTPATRAGTRGSRKRARPAGAPASRTRSSAKPSPRRARGLRLLLHLRGQVQAHGHDNDADERPQVERALREGHAQAHEAQHEPDDAQHEERPHLARVLRAA